VLYIKKLSVEAFRSIRDRQEVNLETLGQNTRIGGSNHDTGGDSGAGKSTIPEAIDYLIGVGNIPSTVLQNRDTKTPGNVVGEFTNEKNQAIIIKRDMKSGLTLSIDGEEVSGTTKAEEKLADILGIPKDLFRKMYHKKQKEGGFFLSLTPKESYQFLVEACGLKEWQAKIDKSDEILKDLKKTLSDKEYEISVSEESLKETVALLKTIQKPSTPDYINIGDLENIDILEAKALEYKEAYAEEANKLIKPVSAESKVDQKARQEIEANILAFEKQYSEITTTHSIKISKIRNIIKETNEELETIKDYKRTISYNKEKAVALIEEIKHLKLTDCPTCHRYWEDETKKHLIAQKEDTLSKLKAEMFALKDKISSEKELEEKLQKALKGQDQLEKNALVDPNKEKVDNLKSELKRMDALERELNQKATEIYEKQYDEYNKTLNLLKTKYGTLVQGVEAKILEIKNINKENSLKKEYYDKAVKEYETRYKITKASALSKNDALSKKWLEVIEIKKNMDLAYESKRAIKSYTMKIFQETLDTIGATASNILNQIPNVQSSSISFESFKEQKNGKIKEEITAMLNNGSSENVDIRSLSGGERSSIDIAVDLAAIDILEDKFNKGMNLFILDEPFDGLDTISKEQYLELLKNLNTNKKLIIIDHSSEVKEMVSDTIIIEKTNGISRII